MINSPSAAYIHVPFCAHRCGYCDFTLVAGKDHLVGDYLRALEIELRSLASPQPIRTLFRGGGTPTHLSADDRDRLLRLIRGWFELLPGFEFSVEANPKGLGREKVDVLAAHGVNRVSLGVQSFDAGILKTLERDHDAVQIEAAATLLAERIGNYS